MNVSETEIKQLFEKLDIDGSGKVNFAEFSNSLKNFEEEISKSITTKEQTTSENSSKNLSSGENTHETKK